MHSTDMDMKYKGASRKRNNINDVQEIEWTYMMALDNSSDFRMFCSNGKHDGMTLRDDGIAVSVDPALVDRLIK